MIPIFKPYMPEGVLPQIESILYSGNLAFGKYGRLFETSLQEFIGNPFTLTVSSYNQAVLVVLSILGLKTGDEVIASPVSCLASNQPLITKNLKIIWADVNPDTGSLDPEDVKKRITSKTKAIFHNHFCGFLGEIDEVNAIAKNYGIFVVDDCIEAFGSTYKEQKMGNVGSDISIFSFQAVRLPNTIDGAAISFKSREMFERGKKIRDYGIDRKNFRNAIGEISADCDIELEGYGALMNEVNSYIGIAQMEHIDRLLEKQKHNAIIWNDKIQNLSGIQSLKLSENSRPNYWVYGLLCENKQQVLEKFRKEGWYASSVHINNNIYSVFNNKESLEGVNKFVNKFLAIPCGWWF